MMRQLQNVPATELKIDMSFVENMHVNHSDMVMVEKIIEMGHELGMEVIAEGVRRRNNTICCARWDVTARKATFHQCIACGRDGSVARDFSAQHSDSPQFEFARWH